MNPKPHHPNTVAPSLEEWDDPAMAEFKRKEAEERAAFGRSPEARLWLERFRATTPPDMKIRLARKGAERFPFKPVKLLW